MSRRGERRKRSYAFIEAALLGDTSTLKTLLTQGAPVDARDREHGETALMLAAMKGYADVVCLLLDNGADINAQDTRYGMTALMQAARSGHRAVVALLLQRGARPDIVDYGIMDEPKMVLGYAETRERPLVVELLKRADVKE